MQHPDETEGSYGTFQEFMDMIDFKIVPAILHGAGIPKNG